MTQLSITMPDELTRFLQEEVQAGRYRTPSEAVADAVYELKDRERAREMKLADLRTEIGLGLADSQRGEVAPWDPAEMRREGRALLEAESVRE